MKLSSLQRCDKVTHSSWLRQATISLSRNDDRLSVRQASKRFSFVCCNNKAK